jgi:hypothetical protein
MLISDSKILCGIIRESIQITNSAEVTIHGIIIGDISITENSKLILNGALNGNISGKGAGKVYGTFNPTEPYPDSIIIESGSIVNGVKS